MKYFYDPRLREDNGIYYTDIYGRGLGNVKYINTIHCSNPLHLLSKINEIVKSLNK